MAAASRRSRNVRDGFTLVEVVVAMVLLSAVLVMLAGMTFTTAQRSMALQSSGTRQALMLQAVNRLTAVSYDSLTSNTGCRTMVAPDGDTYTACMTLQTIAGSSNTRRVQVVLNRARAGVPADTLTFVRSRPLGCNVLNTGVC